MRLSSLLVKYIRDVVYIHNVMDKLVLDSYFDNQLPTYQIIQRILEYVFKDRQIEWDLAEATEPPLVHIMETMSTEGNLTTDDLNGSPKKAYTSQMLPLKKRLRLKSGQV